MTSRQPRVRILLVDDSLPIRELLSEYLTTRDCEVIEASDGQEAVDLLQARTFDVLIADVRIPKIDGMELLRIARQLEPPLPCIMMTGFATVETAVAAFNAGVSDYVEKPFKLKRVWDAMTKAIVENQKHRDHGLLQRIVALHRRLDSIQTREGGEDLVELCSCACLETSADGAAVLMASGNETGWQVLASAPSDQALALSAGEVEGLRVLLGQGQPVLLARPSEDGADGLSSRWQVVACPIRAGGCIAGGVVVVRRGEAEAFENAALEAVAAYAVLLGNSWSRVGSES